MEKIKNHSVTICVGPAGTGKTHIALVTALGALDRAESRQIILARPAVEAGGEKLGFLPGDMEQKVNPICVRCTIFCVFCWSARI